MKIARKTISMVLVLAMSAGLTGCGQKTFRTRRSLTLPHTPAKAMPSAKHIKNLTNGRLTYVTSLLARFS